MSVQLLSSQTKNSKVSSPKIAIPRALAGLFNREVEREPANKRMSLMMFQPMEITDWCRIWIPEIDPEITTPAPGETKNPYGYLSTVKITLSALTGYSERTVEKWVYYPETCPYLVKRYLRCLHILYLARKLFKFPVDFPSI